jgi:hypothetical protein
MAGIKAYRKIQLGVENPAGTAAAATALWRGKGVPKDDLKQNWPEEDIGYVSGVDRSYIPQLLAGLEMEETEATFEQLPYLGAAGIKNVVTGSADGGGSDKIYAYPFPTTSANTIKTYTLEGGDDQQEEEMEYSFVSEFKLSGKGGPDLSAVMMSAMWIGRQLTASSFTGAIAVPSVEEILFGKSKLYIDAVSGTIGTTQQVGTFLGFEFNVKTGWVPRFSGDGNLYFTRIAHVREAMEILCKITFEHDSYATAQKTAWRSKTSKQIRIDIDGNAVTTPGTSFSTKKLRIDLAGRWDTWDKIGEQNGNDILTGTFRAKYNATAALFAEMKVVNELASLT